MKATDEILFTALHGACEHGAITVKELETAFAKLEADARARWSVRVLGAWGLLGRQTEETRTVKVRYSGTYKDTSVICARHAQPAYNCPAVKGDANPDAARLAAAEAVFPTLPADVRASIGEKP
jgi:hypothetical protein